MARKCALARAYYETTCIDRTGRLSPRLSQEFETFYPEGMYNMLILRRGSLQKSNQTAGQQPPSARDVANDAFGAGCATASCIRRCLSDKASNHPDSPENPGGGLSTPSSNWGGSPSARRHPGPQEGCSHASINREDFLPHPKTTSPTDYRIWDQSF